MNGEAGNLNNLTVEVPEDDAAGAISGRVAAPATVGGILRQAREEQGLSTEAVAEVLRFSVRQIEHIENDDYQALPGATLVRGFIRGYAKFLRLDPHALIAQLDAAVPQNSSDVRPPSSIAGPVGVSGLGGGSVRMIAVALVVLAVCVFGLYLFVEADEQVLSQAQVQLEQVNKTALPAGNSQTSAESQSVASVNAETPPLLAPEADATVVALPEQADVEPVAISAPVVGLLLEFDDLSWVEARDANQAVVLVGEFPKGTRKVVEGKAPFTLWIGRASAVRVSNQGRVIDLKAFTREDVARLTVD